MEQYEYPGHQLLGWGHLWSSLAQVPLQQILGYEGQDQQWRVHQASEVRYNRMFNSVDRHNPRNENLIYRPQSLPVCHPVYDTAAENGFAASSNVEPY